MANQRQPIGLFSATTLVVASMIGVGVYTTSGFTLAALGSPWLVLAAWVVAGLIATSGAIGYASLSMRFAESGGEYMFLARSLHPVAGLIAGWVSLLAGFTGAIAIAALGLESYLRPLLDLAIPNHAIAIGFVFCSAMLHTVGVGQAARVQNAIVVFKLVMIAAIVVFAVASFDRWQGVSPTSPMTTDPFSFVEQLVWISFSFAGFNAAVYVADEVVDPRRNVPRAMIGATVSVSVIYLILNTIFVFSAKSADITASHQIGQVAATAAQAMGGDAFELFVRSIIVVSLASSVSALVMSGPRVYAKMADDGLFPSLFRFDQRPPVIAIWFQAILAITVILISTLKDLLGYLGLTLSVCSALTVAMVFLLRRRGQISHLPWLGIPAGFYVVSTLGLAVLYAFQQPSQTIALATTIGLGFLLYPLTRNRSERDRHE